MQFAFTEEQDLLRREAREVLPNGGWGREELDELGFLDRAVLFEEAGRANRGEEFFDPAAPASEQRTRARRGAREDARAIRPAHRRLPGRGASTRRCVRRHGAGALDRLLGC